MACPNTRDFSAWINLMPGAERKLILSGEVETRAGNLQPKLTAAEPQGINPRDLLLILTIEECGDIGTDDVAFRPVRFETPAGQGQYTTVTILHDGDACVQLEVGEAR